ncbi:hypothetical protein HYW43_03620 [Candidatus Daviesbacteria bacterium]|nr:hypothetical protein [Candidatus Daviesbacteria bacterium]
MTAHLRDHNWLLSRLDHLWSSYFMDVSQDNPIFIRFGRYSKYRLGSIKLEKRSGKSKITITGMFRDPKIPVAVVDHTIAHELVHYAHGFSSKKVRLHRYPHAGGIVNRELERRGMKSLIKGYKAWIQEYKQTLR